MDLATSSAQIENRRTLWLSMSAVFIIAFALYIATLTPEFQFDDNPEFVASSYTLGVTHPPGYVMLSMPGKLFTYLAPQSVPMGANLFSAFCAAAACALLCRAIWMLTGRAALAALFALLFALSRLLWSQALEAEVYAPSAFLLSLLLNLTLDLDREWNTRLLLAMFAAAGIAVIVHYTALLALPVFALYVLYAHKRSLAGVARAYLPGVFLLFAAFAMLMYLPLRAASSPPIHWGATDTVRGFLAHLRGVETLRESEQVHLGEKIKFIGDYIRLAIGQVPWPWLLFLIPGVWSLVQLRRRGTLIACLFLATSGGFLLALNYLYGPRTSYVVSFFYLASFMFLFMVLGLGAAALMSLRYHRKVGAEKTVLAAIALLVLCTAVAAARNSNMLHNRIAFHYGRNILLTANRDAAIFSPNVTESFPLAALRNVYGMRQDAVLYGKHGDAEGEIGFKGDPYTALNSETIKTQNDDQIIARLLRLHQVYLSSGANIESENGYLIVDGLLFHVRPQIEMPDASHWDRYDMDGIGLDRKEYNYIDKYVVTKYFLMRASYYFQRGQFDIADNYFKQLLVYNPQSQFLLMNVALSYFKMKRPEDAVEMLKRAASMPPEEGKKSTIDLAIYNNLSVIYMQMGKWDDAIAASEKAVDISPPEFFMNKFNLGKMYFEYANKLYNDKIANPQLARNYYLKALKTFGELDKDGHGNSSTYTIMGKCSSQLGDYFNAENYYKLATADTSPGASAEPFFLAGLLYDGILERPNDAITMYEKYLQLVPESIETAQVRIYLARLYYESGNYAQALFHLKKIDPYLKQIEPVTRTKAYYYAALSLAHRGQDMDALHAFRDGAAIETGFPEMHLMYGIFLQNELKVKDEALNQFKQYLEKSPDSPRRKEVEKRIEMLRGEVAK